MSLNKITEAIIGAAIAVHRELGPGLLESTYEACLAYELVERRMSVERQKALPVVPVQRVILKAERSFEPGASWPREKLEPPASLKAPRTLSFLLPMRRSAKEKSLSASLKGAPPILEDEWSDNMR